MKIILLGCGSSSGVPMIGCDCKICRSANPKNKRTRVSVYIEIDGLKLLIDSSPDLREQALRHDLRRIDAVLYTHDHADHTHGLDELRSFNYLSGNPLPIYGSEDTIESLKQRFPYAFLAAPEQNLWFRPSLLPNNLPKQAQYRFLIGKTPIIAFEQQHGKVKTLGYRIGNFAYSTDTDALPESAFATLKGVETWIVDCLRYGKSHAHSNLENTLGWVARVKPKLALLTHMSHDFDYETLSQELPSGVVPGYDGMII